MLVTDLREVSRGELSEDLVERLDEVLATHSLPQSSPFAVPELLASVCLNCGSIAEAPTQADRDATVDCFDMVCCGLTVIFHSSDRVLVDPANLREVRQVCDKPSPCNCGSATCIRDAGHTNDCCGGYR